MARPADPEKRPKIIAAAIGVFAAKGYAATRIIDVARAAGIGKGTVYEYFSSKEDLFFQVFQYVMTESDQQMAGVATATGGSVADRITAMGDTLIRTWLDKLELYSLVMEFWSAASAAASRRRFKSAFSQAYAAFRRSIGAMIAEGMASGEFSPRCRPEALASGLIAMWDALLLQAWTDPAFDALDAARVCLAVMLDGMRAGKEVKS